MSKEIKLSERGKYRGQYVAIVDDEDYPAVSEFRWHVMRIASKVYAATSILGKEVYLHKFVLHLDTLAAALEVDHVDGNGLNCQKQNLRECTHLQNSRNKQKREARTLPIGVSLSRRKKNPFVGTVAGIHVGTFRTAEDAARARDAKAKELFGEFANLNFSDSSQ